MSSCPDDDTDWTQWASEYETELDSDVDMHMEIMGTDRTVLI
jgi:hypothetical protein